MVLFRRKERLFVKTLTLGILFIYLLTDKFVRNKSVQLNGLWLDASQPGERVRTRANIIVSTLCVRCDSLMSVADPDPFYFFSHRVPIFSCLELESEWSLPGSDLQEKPGFEFNSRKTIWNRIRIRSIFSTGSLYFHSSNSVSELCCGSGWI